MIKTWTPKTVNKRVKEKIPSLASGGSQGHLMKRWEYEEALITGGVCCEGPSGICIPRAPRQGWLPNAFKARNMDDLIHLGS